MDARRKEADSILASINSEQLPVAVRHGIAPAMKATMPGTFWGTSGEELPPEARKKCGCDERDGKHLPETFKDMPETLTARECMQGATARTDKMTKLPLPPRINGTPPDQPNGYTDGSYVNPTGHFWSLGGVGVWWPKRETADGIAQAEEAYTHVEQLAQGTLMWQTFNDLRGSSTRCEIGAMLLAMLREEPIHIGTDSQAMLTKLQQMLDHAKDKEKAELHTKEGKMKIGGKVSPLHAETPFRRKWHQQQDGDLWECMHESIQSRNHSSIEAKKVKGHATEAMVEAKLVEPEDKDGNDWADTAAGKGTHKFSPLATIARKFSIRNDRYRNLMSSIHRFIINMLKAHKEEEEEKKKQLDPFNKKEDERRQVGKRLEYVEDDAKKDCKRIEIAQLKRSLKEEDEKINKKTEEIRNFYTHLQWKRIPEEEQREAEGITWLELFILFHRHGGSLDDKEDVLGNKNSLQKDVADFKRISRKVFLTACPIEDEWVLKPSTTRRNRLKSIAVANKHASIKGMPLIIDEENKQIVKRILAMRSIRSAKMKKVWEEGNLKIKPAVISLKGGSRWLKNDDKDEKMENWVTKGFHGEAAWSSLHETKLKHMYCPICQYKMEVKDMKLVKGAQFSNLTCSTCTNTTNSREWKCECNRVWHKCNFHIKGNVKVEIEPIAKQVRKKKLIAKGIDKPIPKLRRMSFGHHVVDIGSQTRDYYRVNLPQGSKLALRFPHLSKQVGGRSHADNA